MAEPKIDSKRQMRTDDDRWQAMLDRNPAADRMFVFAVTTTGIYCRPSCPARRPKRSNIRFYASCAEAELAGYRACKRCCPNGDGLHDRYRKAVTQVCRQIEQGEISPSLTCLATAVGMSRYHLQRVFQRMTGVTPKEYAQALRVRRVQSALSSRATVTNAMISAGYGSSSRFYENAETELGMTPTAYRQGGSGTTLRMATAHSSLGCVLVAGTHKGIAAILLGDNPEDLFRDLQVRFPKAAWVAGDSEFDSWVTQVVAAVAEPRLGCDLPLDIRGTAFQIRVWNALRRIPPGTTVSYTEIARGLGKPTGARAVAQACVANPVAVAIPCHRVIRSDGTLAGYRWGIDRKVELLKRESQPHAQE